MHCIADSLGAREAHVLFAGEESQVEEEEPNEEVEQRAQSNLLTWFVPRYRSNLNETELQLLLRRLRHHKKLIKCPQCAIPYRLKMGERVPFS